MTYKFIRFMLPSMKRKHTKPLSELLIYKLIGNWIYQNNKVVEDETTKKINYLRENYLIKIATDNSGWEILYQDPNDKRFWELTYSDSEYHGGGAPSLININEELARKKYEI